MPEVTLLNDPWKSYTIMIARAKYEFKGGNTVSDVPVPVALEAQKKKNAEGGPLFKVTGMPDIVEHGHAKKKKETIVEQNVPSGETRQFDQLELAV